MIYFVNQTHAAGAGEPAQNRVGGCDGNSVDCAAVFGGEELAEAWPKALQMQWKEGYGTALVMAHAQSGQTQLCVHWGDAESLSLRKVKELCAIVARGAQKQEAKACTLCIEPFVARFGAPAVHAAAQGITCGLYAFSRKTDQKQAAQPDFYVEQKTLPQGQAAQTVAHAWRLAQDIAAARDWVNMPGNELRPADFARLITQRAQGLPVEVECLPYEALREQGFGGIVGVGGASAYPPCLLVLRYHGAPDTQQRLGIAGKGVTCDTGGYCVKSTKSMAGIKGDMAGAAATAAAVFALAANGVPVNVTACLPLCENRISNDATLPGDVLGMYGGKTVEVLNTDAEGRLILADAMAYLAKNEHATQLADIATLTGAAWSALGYTIGAAMCDNDALYARCEAAQASSAECFVRFPFGEEHEKMIRSEVADLKNVGGDCCGVITAGLFIRAFAQGLPWLHLDIAGTAWNASPTFKFETFGATGAGAATLYHLAESFAQSENTRL